MIFDKKFEKIEERVNNLNESIDNLNIEESNNYIKLLLIHSHFNSINNLLEQKLTILIILKKEKLTQDIIDKLTYNINYEMNVDIEYDKNVLIDELTELKKIIIGKINLIKEISLL